MGQVRLTCGDLGPRRVRAVAWAPPCATASLVPGTRDTDHGYVVKAVHHREIRPAGQVPYRPPMMLGHEGDGRVAKIGDGIERAAPEGIVAP